MPAHKEWLAQLNACNNFSELAYLITDTATTYNKSREWVLTTITSQPKKYWIDLVCAFLCSVDTYLNSMGLYLFSLIIREQLVDVDLLFHTALVMIISHDHELLNMRMSKEERQADWGKFLYKFLNHPTVICRIVEFMDQPINQEVWVTSSFCRFYIVLYNRRINFTAEIYRTKSVFISRSQEDRFKSFFSSRNRALINKKK